MGCRYTPKKAQVSRAMQYLKAIYAYQISIPKQDAQKRKKHTTNGTCSLSGLINRAGMKAHIQMTNPIKSFVSR